MLTYPINLAKLAFAGLPSPAYAASAAHIYILPLTGIAEQISVRMAPLMGKNIAVSTNVIHIARGPPASKPTKNKPLTNGIKRS